MRDCVCNRQGDDGINVHSQYAVATEPSERLSSATPHPAGFTGGFTAGGSGGSDALDGLLRVAVGPNANSDNTSWGCIFSRPVFRVGDTVAVRRRSAELAVVLRAAVTKVEGRADTDTVPIYLTLADVTNVRHLSAPLFVPFGEPQSYSQASTEQLRDS